MDTEYSLVMKFPEASPSSCNGYEMGMLPMRMQAGETSEGHTVCVENREQIEVMARSSIASQHGYTVEFEDSGVEGWLYLTAIPSETQPSPLQRFKVIHGGLA